MASRSITARLVEASIARPRAVLWTVLVATLIAAVGFVRLDVDTDPENMLPADDPVRVRNAELADTFGAGPMIVVGLFGDVLTPEGVAGVLAVHGGLVDRDDVDGDATVSLRSVVDTAPTSTAEVDEIVALVEGDQLLRDNIVFADRSGVAVFVRITDKDVAVQVADAARELIDDEPGLRSNRVEIAGQPLAEDAFGTQMFVQMAVFAPLAGMLVFVLMWAFFRRIWLVLPAMALAMATVIITMGALVGSGNTLHIMSSMIPIFLMPIAILDSVHVLSDFFDRYDGRDRPELVTSTLEELSRPIGYTTMTTGVGFLALTLVPIPPVRVFGLFVALGVAIAWLLTMTMLPAFMVSVRADRVRRSGDLGGSRVLPALGRATTRRRHLVLAGAVLLVAATAPGLASVTPNDNPVRWFRGDHEIRMASEALGDALPGTFTASIIVTAEPGALDQPSTMAAIDDLADELREDPEVGAVQVYTDGDHPLLRNGDTANIRLQLRTGDNTAMQAVVDRAEDHLATSPVPATDLEWAGEAYLNLTWQDEMVRGMLVGFATTLAVIFVLLVALFRSPRWALLAIAPVVGTVVVVYGLLSYLGRDMDMPIAVLSTMVLGIGVDFAIHFVERYRELIETAGDERAALVAFFREPATAMTRNAVVIAIGFTPLLLSSLVPYVVVGVLLATIISLSWLASIIVLPAAVARPAT
ncbi:MAG: MMPL family transporter [Actinomycetota bacterium]